MSQRDHHHDHHDHHDHAHGRPGGRAFAIGVVLNTVFVAIEFGFGIAADSLALLADAAHNLSDVAGLLLSWGAAWAATRPASTRRTYGFGRGTILAALTNGAVLLVGAGALAWEAVGRFGHPQTVAETTVLWVAVAGIVVNGATAWLFMSGAKGDLNVRAAFWHMAGDALVSLGVVVAALVMGATGWLWVDPATSLVIVAVIAAGTWGLFREALDLSLDGVPPNIDRDDVAAALAAWPGVDGVHDLHIWSLSTTSVALTAHLVVPEATSPALARDLAAMVKTRFGIDHSTIQIETAGPCLLAEMHRLAAG